MTLSTSPATEAAERLRRAIHGRIVTAADADYDAMRAVMAPVDRRPAVIIRVADANDVAEAVRFAAAAGLEVAVRSGGHSGAGHGVTEGGVVIDLRDMKGIEIDADSRTAWADGGVTAREYTEAAEAHGLATGFGDAGSVGITGLALGGGIGYLVRKHGLTIDSLLEAEIVTADGDVRRVSATEEPDLFWAIRGGGGNFGVVTRLKLALHPVDGFAGGMIVLPATAEVVAGFIAAADAAPDELSTILNVMPCPPMPFVPQEVHGSVVAMGQLAWTGGAATADAAFAPFRALATPIADLLRPMRYAEMFPPDAEGAAEDPHPAAVAGTMFVDGVDLAVAETIVGRLGASGAPMRVAQLRVLGGAMARIPADATAFAHRSSRVMVALAAFYESPEQLSERQAWVEGFAAALQQSDEGAYVNFIGDEGQERVRAAYPGPTWDRLRALKRRYDPTNLFRLNQNVPPAAS